MNFIDLFSGAGGLSEGFIKAGFTPIAHVEMDKNACKTLETRLVYHKLKCANKLDYYHDYLLGHIPRDKFLSLYSDSKIQDSVINTSIGGANNAKIFKQINELAITSEVDLVIGGPPCQAYSLVGRSRDKNKMRDDSRNYLYKEYAKFLKEYRPKLFVFENVLGLITANQGKFFKNMKSYFRRIGYHLDYSIETASDYGVLQNRKRIILIGWRKDIDFSFPEFDKIQNTWTVSNILEDLKGLKPGDEQNITYYKNTSSEYLSSFSLRNGVDFVTQHIARPHNKRDIDIYRIAINKWMTNSERLKYNDLPERLKTHKNQTSFLDRFKVVDANGHSHTMVAHISKDGHHYIYPDINQVRSISVREAARIQSFPDNFYFEGGRSSAFRQIGNAVPPLMAKKIADKILNLIE